MDRVCSPVPDDSASQMVSEPLSGTSGVVPMESVEFFMQALKTLEAVSVVGYDPSIVAALSEVPGGLKLYFDRVDKAREASAKRVGGMVHSIIRKFENSGASVVGSSVLSTAASSVGSFGTFGKSLSVRQSGSGPALGGPGAGRGRYGVVSCDIGTGKFSSTSTQVSSSFTRSHSVPVEGYCYLDMVKQEHVAAAASLDQWPAAQTILSSPSFWFAISDFDNLHLKGTGSRVHVVRKQSRRRQGKFGNAFCQLSALAANTRDRWLPGTLGSLLSQYGEFASVSSPILCTTLIGGTGADGGADPDLVHEGVVRKAVVDHVIGACGVEGASRSHLWEAVQLAGGLAEVDGRVLLSGNKVLALVGDSALRLALLLRATTVRIGDAQVMVSDVLSNATLARVGRIWNIPGVLQGTVQGTVSDYVLATAVEAIAGACYYGGGVDCVGKFLLSILEYSGFAVRHRVLYDAQPLRPAG